MPGSPATCGNLFDIFFLVPLIPQPCTALHTPWGVQLYPPLYPPLHPPLYRPAHAVCNALLSTHVRAHWMVVGVWACDPMLYPMLYPKRGLQGPVA